MYLANRLCLFPGYSQCQAHKQKPDTICSIKQTAFSYTHRHMQWERETGIQTKRSRIYTRIDKQKICVPMLFFFLRLFGFLPPIRTWNCLCLYYCCCFLSFRFHYLPHSALYLYLFLVPCKQNIQISRHVMFYNLSYRYVRVCMHTYLFFIATVYKYIWISHVGMYIFIFVYCYCVAFWQYDVFFWWVLFLLLWF